MTSDEMSERRPRRFRWVVGVVALIFGILVFGWLWSTKQPLSAGSPERPIAVRVIKLEPAPVRRSWPGFGSARAMREAVVAAQISGRVINRPDRIEAGVSVRAGTLIIEVDPSDYEDALAAAEQSVTALEARLEGLDVESERLDEQLIHADEQVGLANEDLRRLEEASGRSSVSEVELIRRRQDVARLEEQRSTLRRTRALIPSRIAELRAELVRARSTARAARRDQDRTRVQSPIDGVLQEVMADTGEYVGVGQAVTRVVDLSRIEIPVRVPASASGRIAIGERVTVRSTGVDNRAWEAEVVRVAPVVEETRSLSVFLELEQSPDDDPESLLLPGRFVTVSVVERASRSRLIVPRRTVDDERVRVARATTDGPTGYRVGEASVPVLFYIEGRFPSLDPTETEWAVIEGGLSAGDLVIVSNLDELDLGMAIEVRLPGIAQGETSP